MAGDEQPRRRPTMADVARLAGVSVPLVSLVFRDLPGASPENRQRVMRAAEQLGYHLDAHARLLRSGRSRLLGVVFTVQADFHGDLVVELYEAAAARGYDLTLSAVTPRRDERAAIAALLQDRCEALLVLGPESRAAHLNGLAERVPMVVLARAVAGARVDVVRTDDRAGAALAVDHLVDLGHRDIAHLDGGRAPGAADRRRGYREAMRRAGLADRERLVAAGLSEDDGARAAAQLLDGPVPTAVTAFNDRCATGVLEVLRRARIDVPGAVSVLGYDDSRVARLSHVNLTTVAQDTARLADLAVGRAVDRIERREVRQREQIVPPRLVVRGTTAAPQGASAEA